MYLVNPTDHTFEPISRQCTLTGHVDHSWWCSGLPEEKERQWMIACFAGEDRVALDIGAHVGTWTTALAANFATVHAFEPNPEVYFIMCANVALQGLQSKVIPHRTGLSDREGIAEYLCRGGDGGGNGIEPLGVRDRAFTEADKVPIRVKSLDSYLFPRVDFIKIDVEGHELSVLRGATETLARCKPVIAFESWCPFRETEGVKSIQMQKELFAFLEALNYVIRPLTDNAEMFVAEPRPSGGIQSVCETVE